MHGKALIGFVFVVAAAAGPLFGQEEEPPPGEAETAESAVKIADPLLLEPGDLVALCRPDLAYWPSERGRRAADTIVAGGADTISYLMALLDERDYKIKPAVVDTLSRLGHQGVWEPACELLLHPALGLKVKHIFAAMYRLRPAETTAFCSDLLASEPSTLRKAAFNFMMNKSGLDLQEERFRRLVASPDGEQRYFGFMLLGKADIPAEDLNAIALSLVGDEEPPLADEVRRYLAAQTGDAVVPALRELAGKAEDRVFAFAVLTLAARDLTLGETGLPPETASRLGPLLDSNNVLLKAAAASGLTDLCLRSGSVEDAELLRSAVVPAFMEIFLGGLYTRDFSGLLDVAGVCLSRATGAPFDKDLTFWKRWWLENGAHYRKERSLLALNEQDLDHLVVSYESVGGRYPLRFVLASEALLVDPEFQRTPLTCFVRPEDLAILVNAFYAGKLFEHAGRHGAGAAGPRTRIEVRVDRRSTEAVYPAVRNAARPGAAPPGAGEPEFERLDAALLKLFDRTAWQLFNRSADPAAWYFEHAGWWNDPATELERTRRFLHDMMESISFLSEDGILACCEWLRARPDVSAHFGLKELVDLGQEVRRSSRAWTLVRALTDVVVAVGAGDSGRADLLFEPLTTFLFSLYGERALDLIADVIVAMGRVEPALADARWFARAACASVLSRGGPEALPQLLSLFDDANAAVRVRAYRSAALIDDAVCRETLRALFEQRERDTRLEIIAALDGITEPWVYRLLTDVLGGDAGAIQLAAMKGLACFDTQGARDCLFAALQSLAGAGQDWRAASSRLVQAGGRTARDVLFRFLGAVGDPNDRLYLAHQLADLGDTRAVSALLQHLEGGTDPDQVRMSLTLLLVKDFSVETWKYRELWEQHVGEEQAAFLARTLADSPKRVETAAAGAARPAGAAGKEYEGICAADLVQALSDSRWYVRLAALRILQEGAGRPFGYEPVGRSATLYEISQVRRAWEDWLEDD